MQKLKFRITPTTHVTVVQKYHEEAVTQIEFEGYNLCHRTRHEMDCTSTVKANLLKAGLFERIDKLLED